MSQRDEDAERETIGPDGMPRALSKESLKERIRVAEKLEYQRLGLESRLESLGPDYGARNECDRVKGFLHVPDQRRGYCQQLRDTLKAELPAVMKHQIGTTPPMWTIGRTHDCNNKPHDEPPARHIQDERLQGHIYGRFGDGDGSFWDRWLQSSVGRSQGHEGQRSEEVIARLTGFSTPRSGFKRHGDSHLDMSLSSVYKDKIARKRLEEENPILSPRKGRVPKETILQRNMILHEALDKARCRTKDIREEEDERFGRMIQIRGGNAELDEAFGTSISLMIFPNRKIDASKMEILTVGQEVNRLLEAHLTGEPGSMYSNSTLCLRLDKFVSFAGFAQTCQELITRAESSDAINSITALNLKNTALRAQELECLANMLAHDPCTIRELTLSELDLGDGLDLDVLTAGLRDNKSIEKLVLSENTIGAERYYRRDALDVHGNQHWWKLRPTALIDRRIRIISKSLKYVTVSDRLKSRDGIVVGPAMTWVFYFILQFI